MGTPYPDPSNGDQYPQNGGQDGQNYPGGYTPPPGGDPYGQQGYQAQPHPGQQPYPGQQPPYPGQAPQSSSDDNTMALLAHLGGIVTSFVVPLVLYLVKRDDASPYLRHHIMESLNFQITMFIAYIASWLVAGITFGFLGFLPFVVWVVVIVFAILATVSSSKGEWYKYPFALRLVK
ncbi:DUF4870 domain-containing protein [Salinactinospora qingdaonensis]|uniref:DUF4870 domain-containing protein n=1 Tax=Salinactinospora qingdaonensis TaxID=702744 RepID=A0ABP7G6R0_9ACTN